MPSRFEINLVQVVSCSRIKDYNMQRGSHISICWRSCGCPILFEIEFREVFFFFEGRKPDNPVGEKVPKQGENQQQTNPHMAMNSVFKSRKIRANILHLISTIRRKLDTEAQV